LQPGDEGAAWGTKRPAAFRGARLARGRNALLAAAW